jgi:hypothetical protein
MANKKSTRVNNGVGISGSRAGGVVTDDGTVNLLKAELETDNQLGELVILPAGHVPVDLIVIAEDGSTGADIVFDVGILNAAGDDLESGQNLITGTTVAQAGGVARAAEAAGLQLAVSDSDRIIALKITTPATTGTTDADVTVRLLHKPA